MAVVAKIVIVMIELEYWNTYKYARLVAIAGMPSWFNETSTSWAEHDALSMTMINCIIFSVLSKNPIFTKNNTIGSTTSGGSTSRHSKNVSISLVLGILTVYVLLDVTASILSSLLSSMTSLLLSSCMGLMVRSYVLDVIVSKFIAVVTELGTL